MPASTGGAIQNVGNAVRPDSTSPQVGDMYTVMIDVEGDEAVKSGGSAVWPLRANIPERFHMELTSNWNMPFASAGAGELAESGARAVGLGNSGAIGKGAEYALGAAGVGTKLKAQSFQVWESTSPLQLNLDLVFYANENTNTEIKLRHLALLKLCAPSEMAGGGQVLLAPGPTLVGGAAGGRKITIHIGQYLTFENVIITGVGGDIVTMFDSGGIPIAMTINLSFTTWNACITGSDLDKIFGM